MPFSVRRLNALLLCLLPGFALAQAVDLQPVNHEDFAAAYVMQLNAAALSDGRQQDQARLNIWTDMRQLFEMAEQNPELVRHYENYYSTRPDYFNRTVKRGAPYLYHILSEVKKRGMPGEVALLPFIESAFVGKAKSHAGASGIWQFMPKTGKTYGLAQSNWYDGRNDVYAATDAALDYLEYLHGMFGDWALALAAYNWGEGRVQRAVQNAEKNGLPPTFENLNMPKETRHYVPKLLAVRNLVNNPEAFGLSLKTIANQPYFETVSVSHPIDMAAVARLAGIPESEVLALNPGWRVPVWIPQNGRKLLLPKSSAAVFRSNLKKADPAGLLSWQPYRVRAGQSLADIAQASGMSLAELKKLNHIKGNSVANGSILLVSLNTTVRELTPDSVVGSNTAQDGYLMKAVYQADISQPAAWSEPPVFHTPAAPAAKKQPRTVTVKVKKGMTLSAIAKKHGMTVKQLKAANGLKSNTLRPGQTLKVSAPAAKKSSKTRNAAASRKNVQKAGLKKVSGKKSVSRKAPAKKTVKKTSAKKKR